MLSVKISTFCFRIFTGMSLIWTTLPLREKSRYLKLFWSLFSRIWIEYGVSLCIQCKYGKIRIKKTPNTNTFHAVYVCWVFYLLRYINTNTSKLKRSPIGDTNDNNDVSVFPIFEDCFFYLIVIVFCKGFDLFTLWDLQIFNGIWEKSIQVFCIFSIFYKKFITF